MAHYPDASIMADMTQLVIYKLYMWTILIRHDIITAQSTHIAKKKRGKESMGDKMINFKIDVTNN
jgi:hypothetical protein